MVSVLRANMDYLKMKGGNIIFVCCIWLALTTRLTVMAANGQCVDLNGEPVNNGDMFLPSTADPCTSCKCQNGFPIMCQAVACHHPKTACLDLKKIEGECCEYKCMDPPGLNPDLPGQDNSTIGDGTAVEDDSITNLGLRLVASTVTSFLVLALLLFMVHRLRQRRLLLAMRRFEAQARRQQLEESESDQYIPDTYLGMIECPPYEDPPPPYSSPKPHPRILPGEAPPPYEEVDQNRNSNNNNNNSNLSSSQQQEESQCHPVEIEGQGRPFQDERPAEFVRRSLGRSENIENSQRQTRSSPAGRVRSVSPQRSSPHRGLQFSPEDCDGNSGGSTEASHNNSLGRVSNSTDSAESHNCSCDSEQTLLKKTVANGKVSNRTSQTLPPGFCLGQDRSKGRKIKQQNSASKMTQSCQGRLNPAADLSSSPANSSQSLPQDPSPGTSSQKYSSLPPRVSSLNNGQRAESGPVVNTEETCRTSDGAVGFCHPFEEELVGSSVFQSKPSSSSHMSQSCVILRDPKPNRSSQEQLRRSLPPLDFSSTSGSTEAEASAKSEVVEKNTDNQHSNSNDYLRSIRLSNLLNSPIAAFDSPASPVSPAAKPMQRSHSATSEMSVFSVCSETGEKRSSKQNVRVLRNDSQYPDIPISAHAMRMAALAHQSEGQVQQRQEGEGHIGDGLANDPLNVNSTCDGSSPKHCERNGKSKLNTVLEGEPEPSVVAMCSESKPDFHVVHNAPKETVIPKGHRSKKKDKHKQSRHSTGSMVQAKPKKHTHSSAAAILPSNCDNKRSECSPGSSPNHGKKNSVDKTHGSPVGKTLGSPCKTPSKSDASKKKGGKAVCDSYKQYGFIDDPGLLQSKNGIVELRLVNPEDDTVSPLVLRRAATQTDKSVLACGNKQSATGKLDRKRHLTSADKSSYSPSPTRQKSSRPRSIAHSQGQGDRSPSLGYDGLHSPISNHGSPQRKSRNPRSKKRVSYPITGPDLSSNPIGQFDQDNYPMQNQAPQDPANQELDQNSLPLGFITVRNGPLSSYV